jgi:hypothetical protein
MKSDEDWIRQYEDVERSRGNTPAGRSELFALTLAMSERALRRLAGRSIVDGKIVRITTAKDIA